MLSIIAIQKWFSIIFISIYLSYWDKYHLLGKFECLKHLQIHKIENILKFIWENYNIPCLACYQLLPYKNMSASFLSALVSNRDMDHLSGIFECLEEKKLKEIL